MRGARSLWIVLLIIVALIVGGVGYVVGRGSAGMPQAAEAAVKTYVPYGEKDEAYLVSSGGHSGQVFIYGIPSMRRIRTIPVFSPDAATGWGYTEESKEIMGGLSWGDTHHPALSETNGDYDGRWLFINDNANARIARIDLSSFTTREIIGPLPNLSGLHGGPFTTPNTEYVFGVTRFSVPFPGGTYSTLEEYKTKYKGVLAGVKVDKNTGKMTLAWELVLPPYDYDLADSGKGPSDGWVFFTSYNTEMATTLLEVNASQKDRDLLLIVNWREAEKAANEGKYTEVNGARVIDPGKVPGIAFFAPVPKSPHGVDVSPDGRYIAASGKLAPVVTVYDFEKIRKAIEARDFAGTDEVSGIPILKYESVKVAEVPVGNGPLHTQWDDRGYAYTSLFLDSAIAKWKVGDPWNVVDKVEVHYNIGHLAAYEGDTMHPKGKWVVALNKIAKDTFLSVGPSHPEVLELIDISGEKMRNILSVPVDPEPHFAQIISADKIKAQPIYPKDQNTRPDATWRETDARVEREGNTVHVYMTAIRTHFKPDVVEVNQGDTVIFHVTNIEQTQDETHGFAITLYNVDMQVDPGETKTVKIVADRAGVFPFYCTNFCSALHQEMQGYLLVKPKQ
jgi:nitrous-oxide reductase